MALAVMIGQHCHLCGRRNHYVTQVNYALGIITCNGSYGSYHHTFRQWQKYLPERVATPLPDPRFPHKCPNCGKAAYVGFLQVEHASGGGC